MLGKTLSGQPAIYGAAAGAVLAGQDAAYEVNHAMYGAIGSALGTGAGVGIGLLFMWSVYALNRGVLLRRADRDRNHEVESYRDISKLIVMVVTPFILSTAAYNLSTSLNSTVYLKLYRAVKGLDEATVYANYGVFSGKAVTICNIPVAFASAMTSAMIPAVAQLMAQENYEGTRLRVGMAVKSTMILAIPCGVGMFVLAKPVTWLLFPQKATIDLAARLLMAMAVSVVFFSLSTLSSSVLQGIGKVNTPIYNALIALAVQTVTLVVLLLYTNLDLYALVIANIVYSGLMCILNQVAVRRAIDYRQEFRHTFLLPFAAAAVMGVVAFLVYHGLYLLSSSTVVSVIPAILIAAAVYFVLLILFRAVTEQELRGLPKGYLLVKVAKKCRLM